MARPAVLPLVWLDPPAWPLPAGLPAVSDLAPAAAGWLETRRAVRLTRGRPVVVASRSGGAWYGPEASSPGHPAVLSAGRLRLAFRAVP